MVRETHAVCGTVMLLAAATLRTVGDGNWGLVALFVVGIFVLLTSYDRGERRVGR